MRIEVSLHNMRSILLLLAVPCGLVDAFSLATPQLGVQRAASRTLPTTMQFGAKKKKPTLEELGYWPGEWVCADCGYIYEPGTEPPFEELRTRWKCPQCAGPRRRFVKKAGGMVGEVNDNGLYIGTAGAAIAVIALVYVGLNF